MLAHQGILWMHCHPKYECLFPVAPVNIPCFQNEVHIIKSTITVKDSLITEK